MSGSGETDRCGRCGEAVPAGAELCPVCGALLAAYRTPVETSPEVIEPAAPTPAPRETVKAAPTPPPPARGPERDLGLDAARAELLATLQAPAQELAETIAELEPEIAPTPTEPTVSISMPVVEKARPARPVTAAPRSVPSRRARAAAPARPRRPGYVLRGTVEPVILAGVTLLALSFCLVAAAAAVSIRGLGVTGFVLGAVGIIAIVVALMVALVRREREHD